VDAWLANRTLPLRDEKIKRLTVPPRSSETRKKTPGKFKETANVNERSNSRR